MDTPRYGHAPIKMRRFPKEGFWDRKDISVGDFYWTVDDQGRRRIWIMIPHKPRANLPAPASGIAVVDTRGMASEWTINHLNECGAQWQWNGDEDAPTLTPSLHAVGVWHGYVRSGELIEA